MRAINSAGRVPSRQGGSRWFESNIAHQKRRLPGEGVFLWDLPRFRVIIRKQTFSLETQLLANNNDMKISGFRLLVVDGGNVTISVLGSTLLT